MMDELLYPEEIEQLRFAYIGMMERRRSSIESECAEALRMALK